MTGQEQAGKKAPRALLTNIPQLVAAYYTQQPDTSESNQRVSFGTSGHRGSSLKHTFNENHILAICQAICEIRKQNGASGPLFMGKDTHALSEPAFRTAIEVFSANTIEIMVDKELGYTPTPVISHAILSYNHGRKEGFADGVIITPSHNPPEDGGFKYNPINGGPADTSLTTQIEKRANEILQNGLKEVRRMSVEKGLKLTSTHFYDFRENYIRALKEVVNMEAISAAQLKIGVDPMGGAGISYWQPIADRYHLDIDVVNDHVDPTFSFMTLDWDGKIRMDCSSPYAMAGLIGLRDKFDIAFGNDPDHDRHGIVTPSAGLLNPNHYLAAAVHYLFQNRHHWPVRAAVGKTLVSSAIIDRVTAGLKKKLYEVPVGFKWFAEGLMDASLAFGGEESAGASFLKLNGSVWTTDKDGIIMDLLAAEITACTGKDPGEQYKNLESQYGSPLYERIDAPANKKEKSILKNLTPESIVTDQLGGEKITAKLTSAPGNKAAIGGLKVTTENGWFAARPSGTEDIYKIYAESFLGKKHLQLIQQEAQDIIRQAFTNE